MDGEASGSDRRPPAGGSLATAAGAVVLAWSILAILVGLLNLIVVRAMDVDQQAGYCESIDHPGRCASLLPWFVYALTVIAGGSWSLAAGVGFLRRRPGAQHRLVVALVTWTTALLALGALAVVVEHTLGPLVGLGWVLLILALINAGVCLLAALLVSRPKVPTRRES